MKQSNIIVALAAILIVTGGITIGTYVNDRMMEKVASKMAAEEMQDKDMHAEEETYNLQFLSGIQYQPGLPSTLEFTVVNNEGHRLKKDQYKLTHEKLMHVIVVSNDLSYFQHVHPVFDSGTDSFKLPEFAFSAAGEYRIFTDFEIASHDGETMNMAEHGAIQYQDVLVGSTRDYRKQPLGPDTTTNIVAGNKIDLQLKPVEASTTKKRFDFTITRDGKPVTDLQQYLGALGHLVIIREGDLEYLHTHALSTDTANQTGTVSFEADFKKPGNYKAFAQFQRDGQVVTTEFVINVK